MSWRPLIRIAVILLALCLVWGSVFAVARWSIAGHVSRERYYRQMLELVEEMGEQVKSGRMTMEEFEEALSNYEERYGR